MSKKRSHMSLEEVLHKDKIALRGVLDNPEILACYPALGFSEEKLSEGEDRLALAERLTLKQISEKGEKLAATEELKRVRDMADSVYTTSLELARIEFRGDTAAEKAMMLRGKRKRALPGWLFQSRSFYKKIFESSEIQERMTKYGRTEEVLKDEYALVVAVEKAQVKRESEEGEAEAATVARDEAFDRLDEWMEVFYRITDIALAPHPQWKEKLGIVDPS